jgi:hypothetical protein
MENFHSQPPKKKTSGNIKALIIIGGHTLMGYIICVLKYSCIICVLLYSCTRAVKDTSHTTAEVSPEKLFADFRSKSPDQQKAIFASRWKSTDPNLFVFEPSVNQVVCLMPHAILLEKNIYSALPSSEPVYLDRDYYLYATQIDGYQTFHKISGSELKTLSEKLKPPYEIDRVFAASDTEETKPSNTTQAEYAAGNETYGNDNDIFTKIKQHGNTRTDQLKQFVSQYEIQGNEKASLEYLRLHSSWKERFEKYDNPGFWYDPSDRYWAFGDFSAYADGLFMRSITREVENDDEKRILELVRKSVTIDSDHLLFVFYVKDLGKWGGCKLGNQPTTEQSQQKVNSESVIRISATALYSEYNTNEVASDGKYKNKILAVRGVVAKVGYGALLHRKKVCVEFITDDDFGVFSFVNCYFSDEREKGIASQLSKGQEVTITGKCLGVSFASIEIDDCVISR